MTNVVQSIIGSGTIPATRAILSPDQRGSESIGQGVRTGIQTIIANPEDMVAVDAFASSGVAVSTSVLEIVGPDLNPLPRCRQVIIQNTSATSILRISHDPAKVVSEGYVLVNDATAPPNSSVTLPLLHNNSIYAAAAAGVINVRILIF